MISILDELFKKQNTILAQLVNFTNHETFIFWRVNKTLNLYKLHKLVVEELNPLRVGLKVSVVFRAFDSFSKEQKKQLQKFGSIGIFNEYNPHITITRLKKLSDKNEVLKRLKPSLNNVVFDKAALGVLSDHGTVVKIIKEFTLK